MPQWPSVSSVFYDNKDECELYEIPLFGFFTPMYQCVKNEGGIFGNNSRDGYFNITGCVELEDETMEEGYITFYEDAACTEIDVETTESLVEYCTNDLDEKWESVFGIPIPVSTTARQGCWP